MKELINKKAGFYLKTASTEDEEERVERVTHTTGQYSHRGGGGFTGNGRR